MKTLIFTSVIIALIISSKGYMPIKNTTSNIQKHNVEISAMYAYLDKGNKYE